VYVFRGSVPIMVRWLTARRLDARAFETKYGDEDDDGPADPSGEQDEVAARKA
jgi:putative mRNA 3-end processing factor